MDHSKTPTISDQMKTVKSQWDASPSGEKKETALKHYLAAEKSLAANNEAETMTSLDAARRALP